jgi:hypothetical protein
MGRVRTGRMKKEKTEEGEGMAGLRPGKKRGKSWGTGQRPLFFINVLFYFFFVGFLVMAFS